MKGLNDKEEGLFIMAIYQKYILWLRWEKRDRPADKKELLKNVPSPGNSSFVRSSVWVLPVFAYLRQSIRRRNEWQDTDKDGAEETLYFAGK